MNGKNMSKYYVTETLWDGSKTQNYYILNLPSVIEKTGYIQAISLNAFFFSYSKRGVGNYTDKRLLYLKRENEWEWVVETNKKFNISMEILGEFDNIFSFYSHIGYDYKKRRYNNGERICRWKNDKFVPINHRKNSA